jgi:hypothetical protein
LYGHDRQDYKFLHVIPGTEKYIIERGVKKVVVPAKFLIEKCVDGKKFKVPAKNVHWKEYAGRKEIEAPQIRDNFITVGKIDVKIGDMLEITHVGKHKYANPRHAQVLSLFAPSRVELSPYMVDTEVVDLNDFTFSNHNHFEHFEPRTYNIGKPKGDGTYEQADLTKAEMIYGGVRVPVNYLG